MKSSLSLRLQALNLLRWLKEYIVVWGFLTLIYSVTVALVLQPILERVLGEEIRFSALWPITCLLLLVPGGLEALPLPGIPLPRLFGESFWRWMGGPLTPLYLRHELRRGATWLVILLTVIGAALLPEHKYALWVLIAQLPVQRALFSVHQWRKLALLNQPRAGAGQLITAIWTAQVIQALITWGALGVTGFFAVEHWLSLGPALLGSVLAAGSVAMEGDSGRPWMVNFIALAIGTLGGYLCLASPWFLLLVGYIGLSMRTRVTNRMHSVETLDEDFIIP